MERITHKMKLCFLTTALLLIFLSTTDSSPTANSWVGSKYQIECTMCAACDNPCNPSPPPPSPPPPSPPPPATGSNCPPPPSPPNPGTYYYSPPPPSQATYTYSSPPPPTGIIGGTYYPPPYKNFKAPPPPNPIVPYFPFYYYNPPPGSYSGSHQLTNSLVYTITLIFIFFCLF